nr:MAG TPA: hypothetical protein [Caudoviricetes sp.]
MIVWTRRNGSGRVRFPAAPFNTSRKTGIIKQIKKWRIKT